MVRLRLRLRLRLLTLTAVRPNRPHRLYPAFSMTESPVWNTEAVYGDVEYGDAVATLGEVNWTGWQSEPGQKPADCLVAAPATRSLPTCATSRSRARSNTPLSTSVARPS